MIIYICHPYDGGEGPEANRQRVRKILNVLVEDAKADQHGNRNTFVAPQLFLHLIDRLNNPANRIEAMQHCLALVGMCQELWVFTKEMSYGMMEEIERASDKNIPIRFVRVGVL